MTRSFTAETAVLLPPSLLGRTNTVNNAKAVMKHTITNAEGRSWHASRQQHLSGKKTQSEIIKEEDSE